MALGRVSSRSRFRALESAAVPGRMVAGGLDDGSRVLAERLAIEGGVTLVQRQRRVDGRSKRPRVSSSRRAIVVYLSDLA